MQWNNSTDRYGLVAQLLHLVIALLFVGSFAAVYGRRWFSVPDSWLNLALLDLHLSVGLSVLALALLRIWWRVRSRVQPDPLPGAPIEHFAAKAVHGLLYLLMLFMPLTGYLGTGVDTNFYGLFTIPRFGDTALFDAAVGQGLGMSFDEFERPVDWLHKTLGEVAVLVLVGIHAAAALFHQFVRRDPMFARMIPGARRAPRR